MAEVCLKRFGQVSNQEIEEIIKRSKPPNTERNRRSVWNQFKKFCEERGYALTGETPTPQLAKILGDWGVNMRKSNGDEYKEYTVKTIWNVTAKMIQEKYFKEYQRNFNPFADQEFACAREARNAKRKILRTIPEKRKCPLIRKTPKELLHRIQKKKTAGSNILHVYIRGEKQTDTEESDSGSLSISGEEQCCPESRACPPNVVSTRPVSSCHSEISSEAKMDEAVDLAPLVKMGSSQAEVILSMRADPLIEALPSNEQEICVTTSTIDPLATTPERNTNVKPGSVSLVYDSEKVPKQEIEEVEFGDPFAGNEENVYELADFYARDIMEVLLRLRTEKLLLEIEKLKANKKKLQTERKNIQLRIQVLRLRKALANMDINEDLLSTSLPIPGPSLLQVSQIPQSITQPGPTTQTILLAPQQFIVPQSPFGIVTFPFQQKVPISSTGNVSLSSRSGVKSKRNTGRSVDLKRNIKPKPNLPATKNNANSKTSFKVSPRKSGDSVSKGFSDVGNVRGTEIPKSLLSRDRMESQIKKNETTTAPQSEIESAISVAAAITKSHMKESDIDKIVSTTNIISSFVSEKEDGRSLSPKRRKLEMEGT